MRDLIGRTLGHYRVVEKIGEGGMGVVYRAEDTSLKRHVAIKVLSPELAGSQERLERFRREAETLAALDHPNIVHIYSVEEADGLPFLTMQLVEGKRLSELIPKAGMQLERIIEIAIPLAEALAAAHEQGVVHRDLKPANIMVASDGRVKVLDFGLAKLRPQEKPSQATQLPTEPLTEEGRIVGTLPYMSPEQLEGRNLDQRSDIFSLGVILYEMATGDRPFKGDSSVSLILSIGRDTPPEVDTLRADLPHDLARIIRRCLEKNSDQRFQTSRDVCNEVCDLKRESQDAATSWPSVHAKASSIFRSALKVIALAVITGVTVAAIAYLLSRFSESRRPGKESSEVADLNPKYGFSSPEARTLFEQSQAYQRRGSSQVDLDLAQQTMRRALELEPENPLVKAELAYLLVALQAAFPSKERRGEALRLAQDAAESGPHLAGGWLAMSGLSLIDGDTDAAIANARRAKEVAPEDYRGYVKLGFALARKGEKEQALQELHRAIEKEGGFINARYSLATLLQQIGRFDEAAVHYGQVLEYAPDHINALSNLGSVYLFTGRYLEAVPLLRRALEFQPDDVAASNLGVAYFYLDRVEEAIEAYLEADRIDPGDPIYALNLGDAYEKVGNLDSAREWYLKAVDRSDRRLAAGGRRTRLLRLKWLCAAKAGQHEEALEGSKDLAAEEPNNASVLYMAAKVHAVAGQKEGLLEYTERALRAGYPRGDFQQSPEFQRYRDDVDFSRLLEIDLGTQ